MKHKAIDMEEQYIGRLAVVMAAPKGYKNDAHRWWLCLCDCGGLCFVRGTRLRTGETKSCGCLRTKKKAHAGGNLT